MSRSSPIKRFEDGHTGKHGRDALFGGIRDSGYGSEGGTETFDGYLNTKFVTQLNEQLARRPTPWRWSR